MTFPANPVEAALQELRDGKGSPDEVLRALADGDLWVALPEGADAGNARLPIVMLDDKPYVVVFTSEAQYGRSGPTGEYMVVNGRVLAGQLAPELGLPVNPAGLRRIRGGEGDTVPKGTPIRLGRPADEPVELLAALTRALPGVPEVSAAYYALAQIAEDTPMLVVGVRLTTGDARAAAFAVVDAVATARRTPVNMIVMDDVADTIAAWLTEHTTPFYERP